MRLRDLDAKFLTIETPTRYAMGEALAAASGVTFLCPKCFAANEVSVGTHYVTCWFVGVDASMSPGPGRWTPSGTGLDDLTFVASVGPPPRSESVQLLSGCMWHGFVRNGDAT